MSHHQKNDTVVKFNLLSGAGIVASLTVVSRLFGFFRDLVFALLFGASAIADAFFVAFRIPNLLRSFVAEGALTSAFVPILTEELRKSKQHARQTVRAVAGLLMCTTSLLSLLGILFAEHIISFFAPGFEQPGFRYEQSVVLLQIMMPYIFFVSLVAMLNGALNSVGIFGIAALAQVVMNLVLIIGALLAYFVEQDQQAVFLAWVVLIGGIFQIIVQLPALKKSELTIWPLIRFFTRPVKKILLLMLPAMLGAAVYQLSIFINTMLASLLSQGSISWLFYADRITQFPIGVFTIALSSVLLPALAQADQAKDLTRFGDNLIDSLRYSSFLILPTAFGLFMLAEPLIAVIFERGRFDSNSTTMTALAVQAISLGLWTMSCQTLLARAFIARQNTLIPACVGIISLSLAFICALILMGEISELQNPMARALATLQSSITDVTGAFAFRHVGLALSSAFATWIAISLLIVLLCRSISGLPWHLFIRSTIKSLTACLVMSCGLYIFKSQLDSALLTVVIGIPLGAAIYFLSHLLLKSIEIKETLSLIARKIRRKNNFQE